MTVDLGQLERILNHIDRTNELDTHMLQVIVQAAREYRILKLFSHDETVIAQHWDPSRLIGYDYDKTD